MECSAERVAGRHETEAERADRNWNDLLQEFRVLQTGVQILGGFLLTMPFQEAFGDLDGLQRRLYLVLVLLATGTTTLMLAPIAVHRHVFRLRRKERLVMAGHWLARTALVMVGLLVTGIATFVFDVVVDRASAMIVGAGMLLFVAMSLVGVPLLFGGRHPGQRDDVRRTR